MHSFTSCHLHCVWSTKNRTPFLDSDLRERLWPYLGGIARENKMKALAVGGVADHVHILVSLPGTLSVAKAIQLLKGNSSKWIHETFPKQAFFGWQEGYGAFSIGVSGIEATASSHSKSGGASSQAHVSRRIRGDASQAWFGL